MFLLLGAIANVVVAWVGTLASSVFLELRLVDAARLWSEIAPSDWPTWDADETDARTERSWGQSVDVVWSTASGGPHVVVSYRQGFPVRGLRGLLLWDSSGPRAVNAIYFDWSQVDPSSGRYSVLGYSPLWPGFVVNTVFYAAILWLLTLGPFTLRRLIRHKRGLCIKCGYDLRGAEHEVCPECGVGLSQEGVSIRPGGS